MVQTTVEGNLIITDNTRDKFSSEENRKVTLEIYKNIEEALDLDKDPAFIV